MTDADDGCLSLDGVRIGALAAAIAHEVAGPVSYLGHNLKVLRQAISGDPRPPRPGRLTPDEVLRQSAEGLEELRQLVDDLRLLAEPAAVETEVDLRQAGAVALRLAGPMVRRRAVPTLTRCTEPCPVLTHRSVCIYLLLHLLVGASAALEPAGARLELEISREGRHAVASVTGGTPKVPLPCPVKTLIEPPPSLTVATSGAASSTMSESTMPRGRSPVA